MELLIALMVLIFVMRRFGRKTTWPFDDALGRDDPSENTSFGPVDCPDEMQSEDGDENQEPNGDDDEDDLTGFDDPVDGDPDDPAL